MSRKELHRKLSATIEYINLAVFLFSLSTPLAPAIFRPKTVQVSESTARSVYPTSVQQEPPTEPTLDAASWAERLGVSLENFEVVKPEKVTISNLTEAEYQAKVAQMQARAAVSTTQKQLLSTQVNGETVIFPLPDLLNERAHELGLSNTPCATEEVIVDGLMGSDSLNFIEVTNPEIIPPERKTFFEAYGKNPEPEMRFAILNSQLFQSAESRYSKRIAVFYARGGMPIQPGGLTTLSAQIVHADGHFSWYGLPVGTNEKVYKDGWQEVVVVFRLRPPGETRTNKMSITSSIPKTDGQRFQIDAAGIQSCPDGVFLPTINTKKDAPKALEEYQRRGWLALEKRADMTVQDFKRLVARNYGVSITGPDITDVIENWIAVNPNTLYFVMGDETENVVLTFPTVEQKRAALADYPGDQNGVKTISFLPLPALNFLNNAEVLAEAVLNKGGTQVLGVAVDTVKVVLRFGSVGLAMSTFFLEDFYTQPETMRATNAPVLLLYRDGKNAGGASITAGTRPITDIDQWQSGNLPAFTYVNRKQLQMYGVSADIVQRIESSAQFVFGDNWLIVKSSDLADTKVPLLADASPAAVINPDKMTQGSLEALLLTEGLYDPTIVPAEFATRLEFAQIERQRVITLLAAAFKSLQMDQHEFLAATVNQATNLTLDAHQGYFRPSPLVSEFEVQQDLNYSQAQLQQLTAILTEGIQTILNHMGNDPDRVATSQAAIATLFAELRIIKNQADSLGGSFAIEKEITQYVAKYQELSAKLSLTPEEKITLTYLRDDPDGKKRGAAYFRTEYATLLQQLKSLTNPQLQKVSMTTSPQVDEEGQVTHLPEVQNIPTTPEEVDGMTPQQAEAVYTDVVRKILQTDALIDELQRKVQEVEGSPFAPPELKQEVISDWGVGKPLYKEELAQIEAVKKRIEEKLGLLTIAFATDSSYVESFKPYFGNDATVTKALLTAWTSYSTSDLLYRAQIQSTVSNGNTTGITDYLSAKLGAWLKYFQTGQLPTSVEIEQYGTPFVNAYAINTPAFNRYLGNIYTFQPLEFRTAGWYMTESNVNKYLNVPESGLTRSDVTGFIDLLGTKIYIMTGAKSSIGALPEAIAPTDNSPTALEDFLQALAFKIGTQTPTDTLVNELDADDENLRRLLQDVNLDPLKRPEDPYQFERYRPLPLPKFDLEQDDGCYEQLSRLETIQVIVGYYIHYYSDIFDQMPDSVVASWIKSHVSTAELFQDTLQDRRSENNSKAVMMVYLAGIPKDLSLHTFVGAVYFNCSDGSASLELPDDTWVVTGMQSRLNVLSAAPNKPPQTIDAFENQIRIEYPYGYGN